MHVIVGHSDCGISGWKLVWEWMFEFFFFVVLQSLLLGFFCDVLLAAEVTKH
jgi:hypothetical protein